MRPSPIGVYADLSERIKEVEAISHRLYLSAFNALFISRQAGERARGFNRVTTELRGFSTALNRKMENLRRQVEELIRVASERQRQNHFSQLAQQALAGAGDGRRSSVDFATRDRHARERCAANLARVQARFRSHLEDAVRHCIVGESLGVLARMEAASESGGEEGSRLLQVADQVAVIVERMQETLHKARARLDGADNQRERAA